MAAGRERPASDNLARSTPDEAKRATDKIIARRGTYAIDDELQIVTHQLESLPSLAGDVRWTLSLLWERIRPQNES